VREFKESHGFSRGRMSKIDLRRIAEKLEAKRK